VRIANQQLHAEFPETPFSAPEIPACPGTAGLIIQPAFRPAAVFLPPTNYCLLAALHQGNYATIPNYLLRELRYMDPRGMRLKSAKAGL